MPKKIVIYTSEACPFCLRAKQMLKDRGIPFEERLLAWDDDAGWKALTARTGMLTVPQIFADDVLIGGFDDLQALDRKDGLESLRERK